MWATLWGRATCTWRFFTSPFRIAPVPPRRCLFVGSLQVPIGYWSQRVKQEASKYCEVHEITAPCGNTIPPSAEWCVDPDAKYVHITLNETVEGVLWAWNSGLVLHVHCLEQNLKMAQSEKMAKKNGGWA